MYEVSGKLVPWSAVDMTPDHQQQQQDDNSLFKLSNYLFVAHN